MLTLTNSLTKQLEQLDKLPGETVTMYSCGPTVYDHAHIGNLRSFIMDDLLRRTIVASGYKLNAIMNITDIDDKTIHRSMEQYPELEPRAALKKLCDHYEQLFFEDLAAVGVDTHPKTRLFSVVRATDQIPQMQSMITQIHANGLAYISDGSVYFDVAAYIAAGHRYGRLAHIDPSHAQSRIDLDEYDKAEAQDFVLWKGERDGEPSWEFELAGQQLPGRPGWHIECSAMSAALDLPFDIHTGGIDLKFPHHENEIAQTTAATGKDMARIFVHWNHLFVDGKKMSKSLKNFYTLGDIQKKDFSPLAFRLLALQSHYSGEMNFSWKTLEAAKSTLLNLYADLDRVLQPYGQAMPVRTVSPPIESIKKSFIELAGNNLATPSALVEVLRILALDGSLGDIPAHFESVIAFGLSNRTDITNAQKQLITQRVEAKIAKNFAKSDEIRDTLLAQNLEIDDTPNGPRWRRTKI